MDNDRIETLLLKLLEDMAGVKSRLDSIEEIKTDAKRLEDKVDTIESKQSTHNRQIQILENRQNKLEEYVRGEIKDKATTQRGVFISAGLALFGALVSFIFNLL